jgi:membrane-associated phospholipid phosphatase
VWFSTEGRTVTDDPVLTTPDQGVDGELRRDRYVGNVDLTHWYTPLGRGLERLVRAVARWVGPNATLVLSLAIGMIAVVALTALAAEVYDAVTEADGVAGLDHPLLAYALTLRSPALDAAITGYTDVAGVVGMPVLAVVIMLVLALRRRSWTPVILILAAGTGSLLMTIAGKELIGRSRPELADAVPPYEYSPSFPSGHSLNAIVIAGIVAYLLILRQRSTRARILTGTIALLFALTIGLSRVYLGHHWFTDVLAAWALGAAWLAVVITAHRLYLSIRHRGPASLDATKPAASR